MMSDPRDDKLTAMLTTAWGTPRPGWDARALAAMADVRPRRHPNLLTYIIVAALLLLLAAGVFAAVHHFFIEGTLHFHDVRWGGIEAKEWGVAGRFFSGELEWETDTRPSIAGDISAVSGKVVCSRQYDPWPSTDIDILVSNLDWSEEINLTEIAGLGGVNCKPKWSPDGSMIAFHHCDPVEGRMPCHAGHYLWVMNADGSEAHQVTPESAPPILSHVWSPDSSRLAAAWDSPSMRRLQGLPARGNQPTDTAAFTTDIWGMDIQPLPNVGTDIAWSPDGAMLLSRWTEECEVDGQPGACTKLLLTNADGSAPRVLVEQFVSGADALAHWARFDHTEREDFTDAMGGHDVQLWAGPCSPVWSPGSDKIAFLAALPFDPGGPFYKDQLEVWVYDLTTDELIQVTDDDIGQTNIIWK